ncbi:abortive infection protein [Paenibacillus stellifer]|uniref:Abortive infection protein n=1 Tax=Paenibacillus stellifer TaxID=169760 RepID=A0A089N9I9_9BACL|nr:CPBP family intramembrane glutamic endopeptidase [Paenibacillus stellifer]AIQ65434.1 abortive infection protein [Paenibacillus stellifer]
MTRLRLYILFSFGFTWLLWLPLLLERQWSIHLPQLPGQFYLASFGPLLGAAAACLITEGRKGLGSWLSRTFAVRKAGKGMIAAVLLILVYIAAALAAQRLIAGHWPDWSQFGRTEKLPGRNAAVTALIWMLTFGLGEESGWRGYLLPLLHKRYSLLGSSLAVAVIWMLWHLPAFWFNETYLHMGWGLIGWGISLAYGSVLLAWLTRLGNWSVLPVIIWHGGFDLLTASDQAAEVMAMACSMLVIIHGVLLMRRLAAERQV